MRLGKQAEPHPALKRQGRYKTLENGLRIKEVILNKGSVASRRFVIVDNPIETERDARKRDDIISETERRLAALAQQSGDAHHKDACELRAHGTLGKYVRQTKTGTLQLDKAKIKREARLDGKYLISTNDDYLSAEDVALGYKQLHAIERVNRDLKHSVDVRPVYHHKRDRIKAHVLLCWLALLLIRVIENETKDTWGNLKQDLWTLMAGQHRTQHGLITQKSTLTNSVKSVLDALKLKPPKRFLDLPKPTKTKSHYIPPPPHPTNTVTDSANAPHLCLDAVEDGTSNRPESPYRTALMPPHWHYRRFNGRTAERQSRASAPERFTSHAPRKAPTPA